MSGHPGSYLCTVTSQDGNISSYAVVNFNSNNTITVTSSNQEAGLLGLPIKTYTTIQGTWHQNQQRKWRAVLLTFLALPTITIPPTTGQTARLTGNGEFAKDYNSISGNITVDLFDLATDAINGAQPRTTYATYTFTGQLIPSCVAPPGVPAPPSAPPSVPGVPGVPSSAQSSVDYTDNTPKPKSHRTSYNRPNYRSNSNSSHKYHHNNTHYKQ